MRLTHDHTPAHLPPNGAPPSTSHTALAEPEPSTGNGSAAVTVTSNPIGTPPRSDRGQSRRRSWRLVVAGLAVLAVVLVAAAPLAHAAGPQIAGNIDQVLSNIRNWLMGVLAGLATIFFSVGGVRYLMAGGDPGEVEKAKTAWKAAGIGYCGAALAPLIVAILQGLVA